MDILKSSQLVIFSHSTIFITFLQKFCRFSLQTLTKFEAAKTGSGVGFLRLTAVWASARWTKTICQGPSVPQPMTNCHEIHVNKLLFQHGGDRI